MAYKIYPISITDKIVQDKLNELNKDPTRNLSAIVQQVLRKHVKELR